MTRLVAAGAAVLVALALVGSVRLAAQGGTAPPVASVQRGVPKLPLPPNAEPPPSVQAPKQPVPPGSGGPVGPPLVTKKRPPRLVP